MVFKRGIEVKESLSIGMEATAIPVAELYFEGTIKIYNTKSGEVKDSYFICDTIDPTRFFEQIESGEDWSIPLITRLKWNFKKNENYNKGLYENFRLDGLEISFICEEGKNGRRGGVVIPENHIGEFFKVGEKYFKLPELK